MTNHLLKLTRYAMRCLAASGHDSHFSYAAEQRSSPRAA